VRPSGPVREDSRLVHTGAPCRVGHMVWDQGRRSLCASVCRERACGHGATALTLHAEGTEEEPVERGCRAKDILVVLGATSWLNAGWKNATMGVLRGGLASAPGPLVFWLRGPKTRLLGGRGARTVDGYGAESHP
jgi:hypothetical protein